MPSMENETIEDWVNKRVASEKVVIFTKSLCSYCHTAADLLKELVPNDLNVFSLDGVENFKDIMAYFKKTTGAATVPRIFIGGKFFGGCDRLVAEHKSGALMPLLEKAGCTFPKPVNDEE